MQNDSWAQLLAYVTGLVNQRVLFFLHLENRRITLAGITRHPTEAWMAQMARNAVDDTSGGPANVVTCCMTEMRSSVRPAASGSVACFDTTAAPHEYFDPTGISY